MRGAGVRSYSHERRAVWAWRMAGNSLISRAWEAREEGRDDLAQRWARGALAGAPDVLVEEVVGDILTAPMMRGRGEVVRVRYRPHEQLVSRLDEVTQSAHVLVEAMNDLLIIRGVDYGIDPPVMRVVWVSIYDDAWGVAEYRGGDERHKRYPLPAITKDDSPLWCYRIYRLEDGEARDEHTGEVCAPHEMLAAVIAADKHARRVVFLRTAPGRYEHGAIRMEIEEVSHEA